MIIITGGAGFIGSNLVAALEARGHRDLVICDNLGDGGKWRNIARRAVRDIVRPPELFSYLAAHGKHVEAVFHMGAISSTTETDADLILDNNFALSRRLWSWCAWHEVRLIYASSAATYGNGEQGFADDETPEALAALRPLNPYGWSKHVFDRRVAGIVHDPQDPESGHLPPQWAGLKFFNVYGPNEYHKEDQQSVVAKLYPQAAAGAAARLFRSASPEYPDGGQMRDFIYVGDCVDVMLWLYDRPEVNGLFNVGTGQARSFNDLATAVFDAAGIEPKITYFDMPPSLQARYQYFTEARMDKLRAAGYGKPFTSLEDGVRRYIRECMATEDPYL